MSTTLYRLASVTLALTAAAVSFVAIPAAVAHRDLSGTSDETSFLAVAKNQFQLQRDALAHQVRLEVRETSDWTVGNLFLEQLNRAEQGSTLSLRVLCAEGSRSIELTKSRRTEGEGRDLRRTDIYAEALQGSLRSGWLLAESGNKKSFYGVRQLEGMGWSYRDAAPAEDATSTLLKAYPDMGLDCTTTVPAPGSLDKAFAVVGDGRLSAAAFVPEADEAPSGLMVFSEYFMKLGAVRTIKDPKAAATTVEFAYGYANDAGAAGAAFLKARADFAGQFPQLSHRYQRTGITGELTRNRHAVDQGGQVTLELEKSRDGMWFVKYSVTVPHANAIVLSTPASVPVLPTDSAEAARGPEAVPPTPPQAAGRPPRG